MKKLYRNFILAFFLLNCCIASYGQLPNFNFTITATDETCPGNGKLDFLVTGTNPTANMIFTVYKLPDVTSPFRTLSVNSLTGLNAGTYRVIAKQIVGNQENTQQRDAVITNRIVPLEFNMTQSDASACSSNGIITVTVTSGTATGYEIFSGPITRPIQTSNVFNNLVAGSYVIRVHNACGAISRSHTLVTPEYISNGITISATLFPDEELPSCNLITVGHQLQIVNQYYIAYPLMFKYTVRPLNGGTPIILTNTINGVSGRHPGGSIPQSGSYKMDIPYYVGSYSYDLVVTDACGRTYTKNGNVVDQKMTARLSNKTVSCGKKVLIASAVNHKFPITIQFLSAPAGFTPSAFNSGHPSFNEDAEYGTQSNPVPEGTYNVRITDACGRTSTAEINIVNNQEPSVEATNTCQNGAAITAEIEGSRIISVRIMVAPPGFAFPTPYNASAYIDSDGKVKIIGIVIPGNYVLEIKDDCGNTFTEPITVPPILAPIYNISYMGGCQTGFGSIYISRNPTGTIRSVIFNTVPSNYPATLPRDVSANIRDTYFMMDGLPVGTYQATITDACNTSQNVTINVRDYVGNTTANIFERCSSFDLYLSHTNTNSLANLGYWLQKQNPVNGNWEHPTSGLAYDGISIPNSGNSLPLINNQLNVNLGIGARYRVVTASSLFVSTGNTSTFCIHVLREFQTGANPIINQALSFSCSSNLSDVLIEATGSGTLNYKIIEKNYLPFIVNNGTNSLFTGLQIGIYRFQVEDLCGNRATIVYDLTAPFVFSISPLLCNGANSSLSVPNFSYLQYKWYKDGQQNNVLSTNAVLNFNPLNLTTHAGIYHVEISYPSNVNSCLNQTLTYTINSSIVPNPGTGSQVSLCTVPQSINLFNYLLGTYDTNGVWEQITPGGSLAGNIWTPSGISGGIYEFKYVVSGFCGVSAQTIIKITFLQAVLPPTVSIMTPVCIGEPVSFSVTNPNLLYTYSWTGPNGFSATGISPIFPNASLETAGDYYVTSHLADCTSQPISTRLIVNPWPEFHFQNASNAICAGQNLKISVVGENFNESLAQFVWYFEGDEMFGFTTSEIEINEPGIYKARATFNGCSSEKQLTIDINNSVFEVRTQVGCKDEKYQLSAYSINNSFNESTALYSWTGPNGFTSTLQFPDVTGLDSGNYKVIVTSEDGCKSESTIFIQKAFCKIPKGVSPNGDSSNDTWYLAGMDIEKVKIFNRYGTEVYEQNNYLDQWHGQAKNGNLLPSATYYYYIKFKSGYEKTGWVYLNREVN